MDVSQAKRAVALAGEAIRKNGLPKAWMVKKKRKSLAMVVLQIVDDRDDYYISYI